MKYEKSCGGIIVYNGKVLLIQQKSGNVGFPKGHMEENETEIQTAIREVKEETNIDIIVREDRRFSLSYLQKENMTKEVVYFLAKPIGNIEIYKQEDEILSYQWVDIDEVEKTLTFDNLVGLWKKVKMSLK